MQTINSSSQLKLKINNNSKSNLNENRINDDNSEEILDIRKNVNDYYNLRLNEPRGGNNLGYSRNAERGLSPDSKRSHNSNLNTPNTNNKVKQEKSLNNNEKESNKKQEKFNKSIGK